MKIAMRILIVLILVGFSLGADRKPVDCSMTCFECGLDFPYGCSVCARCNSWMDKLRPNGPRD